MSEAALEIIRHRWADAVSNLLRCQRLTHVKEPDTDEILCLANVADTLLVSIKRMRYTINQERLSQLAQVSQMPDVLVPIVGIYLSANCGARPSLSPTPPPPSCSPEQHS